MQFRHAGTLGNESSETARYREELLPYARELQEIANAAGDYGAPQSSLVLPYDEHILAEVRRVAEEKATSALRYIIVIGIGGSNLGAKAVYDALYGYADILQPDRLPKLILLDTTDPEYALAFSRFVERSIASPEEFLLVVVTKSGTTLETAANLEFAVSVFKKKFSVFDSRIVAVTDAGSKLWQEADKRGFAKLSIPKEVGGRYSVFSAAGLLPLALCRIDIEAFRKGAAGIVKAFVEGPPLDQPAVASAAAAFYQYKNKRLIRDFFFFHPELESVGKWYRQLVGESLGKETDESGAIVNAGITPIVSVGSTDLHSMGQLYLGGPKDKYSTFIYSAGHEESEDVPYELEFAPLGAPQAASFSSIMNAIREGTEAAYAVKGLSYSEIVLADTSAFSLGELMQFAMLETMLLGKLMNVNAFDQPNVEEYKMETRKILEQRSSKG